MTTEEIIIQILCYVDDRMREVKKHVQAQLYPSELVTIGILFALKGVSFEAFYRWLKRDYDGLFGGLPDRTRLQRSLEVHQDWCVRFLAQPSVLTVADSYPIALIFPIREGRSQHQLGKKSRDKGRWSVGYKMGWLVDQWGRVVKWDIAEMNVPDKHFNSHLRALDDQTIVLTDLGFRDADGLSDNHKLCEKNTWNCRMFIEQIFSVLTQVCHLKKVHHRVELMVLAHIAFLTAMWNVLHDLWPKLFKSASDKRRFAIADFSL
jgi:hypothetical protein